MYVAASLRMFDALLQVLPRRPFIINSYTLHPTRHIRRTLLRDVRLYYVGTNSVWSMPPAIKYHVKADIRLQLKVQNKNKFSFITSASLVSFSAQKDTSREIHIFPPRARMFVSSECCVVQWRASATGRSLIQGSHTECGVCACQ
jgi:hypothetical protein